MQLGNYIKNLIRLSLTAFFVVFFGVIAFVPIQGWTPTTHAQTQTQIASADALYRTCTSGTGGRSAAECIAQVQQESGIPNYTPGMTGSSLNTKGEYKDAWCTTASTCISGIVYIFTVSFASILAYIGSAVFNLGVQMSLQSAAYSQLFLTTGWAAARDIANMMFIFILIYIAVTIIYSAETHGTMKTLASVIVMALLINFSFFITRVVVDAGNILAVQFYNAVPALSITQSAQQGSINASALDSLGLAPGNKKDLTGHIMNATKVQSLLGQESFKEFTKQNGFLTNLLTQIAVYLMVGWIFAILALSFFAVGFKFIIRVIILWFVIISAPLAFAMRAFSSNEKARMLYNEWQSALLKFSFYPAVFLFIFLIITYILQEMAATNGLVPGIFDSLKNGSAGTEAGAVSLGAALANALVRLGFVVVMLLFGLKAADQIVLHGSSAAEKFTGWASNKVMGWAEGKRLRGLVYRETAGRYANHLNNKVENAKWASQPGVGGWFGTGLRKKVLAPMANKSFGGTRSLPQVLKDKEVRINERKAQLKKIEDKEKAAAAKIRDEARQKRIKSLVEGLGPDTHAQLKLEDIRLIESLTKNDLEKLGAKNVAKIASYSTPGTPYEKFWNEQKNRSVDAIDSFSDDEKTMIHGQREDALNDGKAEEFKREQKAIKEAEEKRKIAEQEIINNRERTIRMALNRPDFMPPDNTPSFVPPGTQAANRSGSGGGGNRSDTGTRHFQNLPELNPMGSDLGRRSRNSVQQTGGLSRSWDNLERKTTSTPELVDLTKAVAGIADAAAKMQATAARFPASIHAPTNHNEEPRTSLPTKTIPTNMTHSMPTRVAEMNPAAQAPTTSAAKNPSWWSVPKADPAAEQLRALHGIREAVEEQKEAVNNLKDTVAYSPNLREQPSVTINQTVVQAGNNSYKSITPEAKQLLESIQKGGTPAFMTTNLRRILQENGLSNSDISQKPLGELLEQLRNMQQ